MHKAKNICRTNQTFYHLLDEFQVKTERISSKKGKQIKRKRATTKIEAKDSQSEENKYSDEGISESNHNLKEKKKKRKRNDAQRNISKYLVSLYEIFQRLFLL